MNPIEELIAYCRKGCDEAEAQFSNNWELMQRVAESRAKIAAAEAYLKPVTSGNVTASIAAVDALQRGLSTMSVKDLVRRAFDGWIMQGTSTVNLGTEAPSPIYEGVCPECRGTGVYRGLNIVEPCKRCGGKP